MRLQNILCPLSSLHCRVCAKLWVDPGLGGGVHGHLAHLCLPPLLLHAPLRCQHWTSHLAREENGGVGTDLLLGLDCLGNRRGCVGHLHGPQQHLPRVHDHPRSLLQPWLVADEAAMLSTFLPQAFVVVSSNHICCPHSVLWSVIIWCFSCVSML